MGLRLWRCAVFACQSSDLGVQGRYRHAGTNLLHNLNHSDQVIMSYDKCADNLNLSTNYKSIIILYYLAIKPLLSNKDTQLVSKNNEYLLVYTGQESLRFTKNLSFLCHWLVYNTTVVHILFEHVVYSIQRLYSSSGTLLWSLSPSGPAALDYQWLDFDVPACTVYQSQTCHLETEASRHRRFRKQETPHQDKSGTQSFRVPIHWAHTVTLSNLVTLLFQLFVI